MKKTRSKDNKDFFCQFKRKLIAQIHYDYVWLYKGPYKIENEYEINQNLDLLWGIITMLQIDERLLALLSIWF